MFSNISSLILCFIRNIEFENKVKDINRVDIVVSCKKLKDSEA